MDRQSMPPSLEKHWGGGFFLELGKWRRNEMKQSHKRPYVILEGLGLWKAMGNTDFCPLILGQQVHFRVSILLHIHLYNSKKWQIIIIKLLFHQVLEPSQAHIPLIPGWVRLHIWILPCLHVAPSTIKMVLPEKERRFWERQEGYQNTP